VWGPQFERLLVNKKDTKHFTISNCGLLPFKWRLVGADALPKEFAVFPAAGELPARSDVTVTVEFTALEKRMCEAKLALQVLDTQVRNAPGARSAPVREPAGLGRAVLARDAPHLGAV
jgi:hydrocephalus-inducing protein